MIQAAFSRADLLTAMEDLAVRVDAAGVSARIYVIGGAALALKERARSRLVERFGSR